MSVAALALLTVAGQQWASAQVQRPGFEAQTRFRDIKSASKKFVTDSSADETEKNQKAIKEMAKYHVSSLFASATKSAGSSEELPMSKVMHELGVDVLDRTSRNDKLTAGQQDLIKIFGAEVMADLKPGLMVKPPYSADKIVLMIDAARFVSIVAKSGYEEVADTAADMINNPEISDAVKLYYFKALKNLFAVRNQDFPEKSVITKAERDAQGDQGPGRFHRPQAQDRGQHPAGRARRDSLRSPRGNSCLGHVRHPIVRVEGKIECLPALVLLRVANMDRSIVPSPSLSERTEALIGYLNLDPDKSINMDFAAGFVGTVLKDLASEYQRARALPAKNTPVSELPKEPLPERDQMPWKYVGRRLSVNLAAWRDRWTNELPLPRPADQAQLVSRIADIGETKFLKQAIDGKRAEVDVMALRDWLDNNKFPNVLLISEDKESYIARPEGP